MSELIPGMDYVSLWGSAWAPSQAYVDEYNRRTSGSLRASDLTFGEALSLRQDLQGVQLAQIQNAQIAAGGRASPFIQTEQSVAAAYGFSLAGISAEGLTAMARRPVAAVIGEQFGSNATATAIPWPLIAAGGLAAFLILRGR